MNDMSSNTGDGSHQSSNHLSEDDDKAFALAMAVSCGSVPPMVLTAVVELDVLEIIKREAGGGHMSPAEIAAHLPAVDPEAAATMLDRMLRVLYSYGVVTCLLRTRPEGRVERTYGLAPVCKFLTRNEDGAAVAMLNQDKVMMECWYHLTDAVLNGGIPFNKAYGMNPFEYQGKDPRFNKVFNRAMSNISTIIMKKIVEDYQGFKGISTLVDVGGGTGATLSMVTSKYPTIKGINFDLPHVIEQASSYPGVEHVGGDMFVSVPKGDAIFMKWICHDWSDEQCLEIMKNCYDALPNHGKVIICDCVMPEAPEAINAARAVVQFDVVMLTVNPGGKERTKAEFEYLAKASGFHHFRIACSVYNFKIIEFVKNEHLGN